MPICKICNCGSGERIGTCHTCERKLSILADAWQRIREAATVIPSDHDARILDGLAEMYAEMFTLRNAPNPVTRTTLRRGQAPASCACVGAMVCNACNPFRIELEAQIHPRTT